MIEDFYTIDCENWDEGKKSEHSMINLLIIKIRELISEVNRLEREVKTLKEEKNK